MKKFKLFGGNEIENVKDYVTEYLVKYPDSEIIVGTDSEQYKNYTNYVTAIGLLRPRKGVHIIYKTEKIKKLNDMFSRLWNEIEYSRTTADELKDVSNITVHIDVNNNKREKSNILHDSAVGYLKGLGYAVESKPNGWVATKAADWLC